MELDTVIGALAAFCTTVSYVPQLKKFWETGSAGDLSLRMLSILALGVALWIGYGALKGDWVIIAANGVSLALLLGILSFKLREHPPEEATVAADNEALRRASPSTAQRPRKATGGS